LYIKKQLAKLDPPVSMQFLLDGTRDSIFPDLFGADCCFDEEDKQVKITATVKASSILMTMITRTMTMEA